MPHPDRRSRRSAKWWAATLLLAAAPKCVVCALAWLPLGAWLGWKSVEICGTPASAGGISWVPFAGGALGLFMVLRMVWRSRARA
ncbi:MAG TPA: hypothetical protein VG936_11390 [Lacunisphaera sp.]|nr:hypothetical protein [Lacunisphaera sp.]